VLQNVTTKQVEKLNSVEIRVIVSYYHVITILCRRISSIFLFSSKIDRYYLTSRYYVEIIWDGWNIWFPKFHQILTGNFCNQRIFLPHFRLFDHLLQAETYNLRSVIVDLPSSSYLILFHIYTACPKKWVLSLFLSNGSKCISFHLGRKSATFTWNFHFPAV
jgi:hypothetical protein